MFYGDGHRHIYALPVCAVPSYMVTVASAYAEFDLIKENPHIKVPLYKVWTTSNVCLCKHCVAGFVVVSVCYCLCQRHSMKELRTSKVNKENGRLLFTF